MNRQYNIWNKWDPLKTVMLGDTYSPEFYRDVKNIKIKSALQQIANETQEDLENYSNILKNFGCDVLRPKLNPNDNIMNYIDQDNGHLTRVPKSPLQPRDNQLVVGKKLFITDMDHQSVRKILIDYNSSDIITVTELSDDEYVILRNQYDTGNWPVLEQFQEHRHDKSYFPVCMREFLFSGFPSPQITVAGHDIYIDQQMMLASSKKFKKFKNNKYVNNNFTLNTLTIGGHNDGQFALLKPGVLMSLNGIQNYSKTFPNWDVCYLPGQSWAKVTPFLQLKKKNGGSWWVPGQEDNNEFTHFVQTWLSDWVGYVEETVFDVNVLVIDEHHVCVSQMNNPIVNAFLKKHKMEPVYVPWRHRYFWDGGLHCITLDLYRDGKQQNYFPDRTECVVCEGYGQN